MHSKVLIVDGEVALVGSANINDRSLCGDRDSEVNLLLRKPAGGGAEGFADSLQRALLTEHLGLASAPDPDRDAVLRDPASAGAWAYIAQVAANNTSVFDRVFGCVPMEGVRTFAHLDALRRAREARGQGHRGSSASQPSRSRSLASSLSFTGRNWFRGLDTSTMRLPSSLDEDAPPADHAGPLPAPAQRRSAAAAAGPGAAQARASPEEEEGELLTRGVLHALGGNLPQEMTLGALASVQGHLCNLPLDFLVDEDLQANMPAPLRIAIQ